MKINEPRGIGIVPMRHMLKAHATLLLALFISSCVAPDTRHQIVISTREQKLALLDRGNLMAIYPVSTSKFGLGDWRGSRYTPLGQLQIAEKIGDNAPRDVVFEDRRRNGGIVRPESRCRASHHPYLRQLAEMFSWRLPREQIHVRVHHDSHKLMKSDFWFPAENFFRLGSVTEQQVHLGWPLITRVVLYELLPIKTGVSEGGFDKLTDGVGFSGSQHKVVSFIELQHPPDALHVFVRISAVTVCLKVAEEQFLLQTELNRSNRA